MATAATDDDASCPVLNRVEQQRNFGIDCGDEILFAAGAWVPGGEHTKKLHVKNVSNRTLKLKYDLPRTKYFSMEFPVLITLSPGTSRVLDIAFRPVQYEEYDDFIRVLVHIIDGGVKATSGSFRLPVKARISMLHTMIPSAGIDFGFCPTADTTEFKFPLHSTGQIDATFHWTLPDAGEHGRPFSIKPASGEIRAGQTLEMTATFSPQTASVYVVTASFVAQEQTKNDGTTTTSSNHHHRQQRQEHSMKISGIGKYAYFAASETDLEFGELIVGGGSSLKHPTDKEFILRNRSLVRASFQIVPVETDHEPVFFFSPLRGVIPPEASVPITVKYTPLSPGTFTCDTFRIQTPGGHHVTVSCRGKAIGPRVSLWKKNLASNLIKANSLNFKDVQVGIMSTRVLVLKNESNVAARFNFMAAPCGVFGIDKVAGVVPPLLDMSITLTFCPENAGNFYRRLFILVQNQSTIYVDILGTGYDNEVRPSPFQQAHVDAYRLRCQHHWGHLSPDGLETLLEEKGDAYFLQGALAKQQMGGDDPKLLTRSGESVLSDVRICDEFFHVATHRSNAIVVSESLLEFFFGSPRATKSLVVTNYTQGKVTCLWRVSETNAFETPTFRIWPTICDIAPGASASFTVSFTPTRGNAYYFAELESHVFFKSNRTFRLVNPQTLTPPWCVVVHASGHSFPTPNSQFLSKVTFETAKPDLCPFPPAYVGDSVYETVSLVNASDTPALFSVVQDPCRVFWVHPPMGRIPPNGFHLVQIRFTPTHPRRYVHRLVTIVNFVTHVTLELTGTGARPQLVCVDNLHTRSPVDTVYIKPTATGLASTRLFYLHNTSRVPLVFRWQVPQALHSTFHLSPLVYRLNGNETAAITCIFSPSQLKQYNQRISVHVKSILNEKPAVSGYPMSQDTSVKLVGVGTSGAISFDPPSIQLPTVLVNSRMAISFHILNSSDCDLIYHLHVIRRRDVAASQSTTNEQGDDLTCQFISFSKPSGTLGARSQQSVELTFQANVAGIFAYKISCAVSSAPVEPSLHAAAAADGTCFHMDVDASASFPSLVIEDLRVLRTPTSTAWTQFQVPALNAFLAAPLTQHEVDFNAESSPDMTTLSSFHMQFTPATEGTPSQVAYVQLRNPGSLVVAYRIYYPSETDVELERWADRGEPTANELRQNIIVDSKLFTISPRSGVLQPHETLVLSLSYSYESLQYDGIHDLSVVLNVSQGKKLTLILHGRTLPVSSPLLFLPSDVCVLHPVQVGQSMRSTYPLAKPCTQQIPVFNCGDQPLQVDIDDSSWSVLNARQFNFPILECRTSRVVVPAHATAFIDVDFCPLQDITYSSELRLYATALHSENTYEQSTTISVVARGYTAPLTFPHMHLSATTGGPPSTSQLLAHSSSSSAALLSHDRVDFGLVCVHTDNVQLVTLTNTSCTATVGFTWDQGHPLVVSKKVLCMPSQGQLLPLQHVLIRIVVRPHIDLMVIDHDIACWIRVLSEGRGGDDDVSAPTRMTNQFNTTLQSLTTTPSTTFEYPSPSTHGNGASTTTTTSGVTRPSVITRSTVSSRSHTNRTSNTTSSPTTTSTPTTTTLSVKHQPDAKRGANSSNNRAPSTSGSQKHKGWRLPFHRSEVPPTTPIPPPDPVYLHIFAYVVPVEFYRQQIPPETYRRSPLPLPTNDVSYADSIATLRQKWGYHDPKMAKQSRTVLEAVLSYLVTEVLNSGAVTEAMAELPLEPPTPVFVQFNSTKRAAKASRLCDDVKRLTATVLENTMFNLIQEIACGEFDLTCLPKQLVFHTPDHDDDNDTVETIQEDRE